MPSKRTTAPAADTMPMWGSPLFSGMVDTTRRTGRRLGRAWIPRWPAMKFYGLVLAGWTAAVLLLEQLPPRTRSTWPGVLTILLLLFLIGRANRHILTIICTTAVLGAFLGMMLTQPRPLRQPAKQTAVLSSTATVLGAGGIVTVVTGIGRGVGLLKELKAEPKPVCRRGTGPGTNKRCKPPRQPTRGQAVLVP